MVVRASNKNIIKAVAGIIYEMHPYHMPEGIDVIIGKLNEHLDSIPDITGRVDDTFKLFEWESWDDMYEQLEAFLMDIPEFRELNVSRRNKEKGIKYGDDENSGIRFVDGYTRETKDERYSDFIDLDACIGNIVNEIQWTRESNEDCFLCNFAKEYGSMKPSDCEQCKSCNLNPNYRFNRVPHPMSLKPHNQWTEEEKEQYNLN